MDYDKMERWRKWRRKGYRKFMLIHLGAVVGFFAFTLTLAYVEFNVTMPESVRAEGGVPIWPAFLVIGIMIPLSIAFSHFSWHRNEKRFAEYEKIIVESIAEDK